MSFLDLSWIPGKRVQPKPIKPVSKTDAAAIEQSKLDALQAYAQRHASQITFYPYDRGQCYDKNAQAVMAIVNAPGACAHYCWSTATKTWEFVQLPHMSTEQRCAERMGYMTIAKMRSKLFAMLDEWLAASGLIEQSKGEGVLVMDGMGSLAEEVVSNIDLTIKPDQAAPMAGVDAKTVAEAIGGGR